jgi:hypothetical protein
MSEEFGVEWRSTGDKAHIIGAGACSGRGFGSQDSLLWKNFFKLLVF